MHGKLILHSQHTGSGSVVVVSGSVKLWLWHHTLTVPCTRCCTALCVCTSRSAIEGVQSWRVILVTWASHGPLKEPAMTHQLSFSRLYPCCMSTGLQHVCVCAGQGPLGFVMHNSTLSSSNGLRFRDQWSTHCLT